MDIKAKIVSLELKIVALGRAQRELMEELEKLKKQSAKPVPPVRLNRQAKTMQDIEDFYTKRKLKKLQSPNPVTL